MTLQTPYGPPKLTAYILPVPVEIVGIIIGKNGEMIKKLMQESNTKI